MVVLVGGVGWPVNWEVVEVEVIGLRGQEPPRSASPERTPLIN